MKDNKTSIGLSSGYVVLRPVCTDVPGRLLPAGMVTVLRWLIAVLLGLLVAACAYRGPGHDDPITRRFTWYSYLNGDDLRQACVPGAPPRYRFVYNGVYVQQVRSYDIQPDAAAPGRSQMRVRVIGPADLSAVGLRPQFPGVIEDLMAPWRGDIAGVPLTAADLDRLDSDLAASGFFQPPPKGLYLRGEDFFWIVTACIGGRFGFNAYRWPSASFERASFPALLLSWDPTGLPLNPPRALSTFDIYRDPPSEPGIGPTYTLTVGTDGLAAVRPLLR